MVSKVGHCLALFHVYQINRVNDRTEYHDDSNVNTVLDLVVNFPA